MKTTKILVQFKYTAKLGGWGVYLDTQLEHMFDEIPSLQLIELDFLKDLKTCIIKLTVEGKDHTKTYVTINKHLTDTRAYLARFIDINSVSILMGGETRSEDAIVNEMQKMLFRITNLEESIGHLSRYRQSPMSQEE